jgi:hypothetical protein
MRAAFFLASALAFGQTFYLGARYTVSDPSGTCATGVASPNSVMVYNWTNGKLWGCVGGTWTQITGGGGGGGGTVTSVGLSLPSIFTVSGSPVTTSGTLTGALNNEGANTFLAGPSSGAPAAPTFRSMAVADLPTGIPNANLQNSSITVNTTAPLGGGGSVALGGSLTLTCATCGGGGGGGTVTSVGLSLPSIFTVSGSPVTSSGTLTGSLTSQSANTVFAGPSSGVAAAPSFRSLAAADLPTIPNSVLQNSSITVNTTAPLSGGGTVPLGGSLTLTCATCGGGGGGGSPIVTFATLPSPVVTAAPLYCSDCTVTSSIDNTAIGGGSGCSIQGINGVWKCVGFSLSFANLPAESDGTLIYCTDCRPTSSIDYTAAPGGTGCGLEGVRGVWVCVSY